MWHTILYYTILSHFVLQLLLTFLSYLLNATCASVLHLLIGIDAKLVSHVNLSTYYYAMLGHQNIANRLQTYLTRYLLYNPPDINN